MDFVEKVMIPRLQKVMTDEWIYFGKLQTDKSGKSIKYEEGDDAISDQFYTH